MDTGAQRKKIRISRILNSFCNTAISCSPRYVQNFWINPTKKEPTSRLAQEGYGYLGFAPELEDFSGTDETPAIRFFPAAEYYDISFYSGGYDFTVPDSIETYLDKVFSLEPTPARQFDIASAWLSQVNGLWPHSSSSALIAVVCSVEALLEKSHEVCTACRQPKFGVTKKIRDLLEEIRPQNRGGISSGI